VREHRRGVARLEIDGGSPDVVVERADAFGRPALHSWTGKQGAIRATRVIHLLRDVDQLVDLAARKHPLELGALERRADVDEWLGQRSIAQLLVGVLQRDLIVAGDRAVAIPFEDGAMAHHAKRVQLGGAQGPHAARAQHRDSLVERGQDLALPDRRRTVKHAVDEDDRCGARGQDAVDVALPRGRAIVGLQDAACTCHRERRAKKYDDPGLGDVAVSEGPHRRSARDPRSTQPMTIDVVVPVVQTGVWHGPQLPPPVQCRSDTSVVSGLRPPATAFRLSSLNVRSVSLRMTKLLRVRFLSMLVLLCYV
jgi:hypothetical protein